MRRDIFVETCIGDGNIDNVKVLTYQILKIPNRENVCPAPIKKN